MLFGFAGIRNLARDVSSLRPETKILYMSGYFGSVSIQHSVRFDGEMLMKPFTEGQIVERVREILAA